MGAPERTADQGKGAHDTEGGSGKKENQKSAKGDGGEPGGYRGGVHGRVADQKGLKIIGSVPTGKDLKKMRGPKKNYWVKGGGEDT